MNSYERVMNRLAGKPVDRLPNLCIAMGFAAEQIRVSYREFASDYRVLTEAALYCHEKFHLDAVSAISDPMREAGGLGAKVVLPEDGVPFSPECRIKTPADIKTLRPADPSLCERMNDRLEAVRLLKERTCGEVPVIGWVEGAVAESCDLMNMSEFMIDLLEEPERMEELLAVCLDQAVWFAREQIRAGADFIGVGDAASSLLGPPLYEEFALPYQKKLIAAIHEAGAKAKLHICGNLTPVLGLAAQSGADIIDLDYMVDLSRAADVFPKDISICGNFDPVSVLLQGTPEEVKAAVKRCGGISEHNFNMIAAGCEVPKLTRPENLTAVYEALKEMRGRG